MSKNIGFTVPPRMADDFEQIAIEEGSTKSELFRRMFRLYQSYRAPLQSRGQSSDVWVERLIGEAQEAERRAPMSATEFVSEIDRAQRYGAQRARALGIDSEKQLDNLLYEKPATR